MITNKHLVTDVTLYELPQKDFLVYGNIEDYVVLALLPILSRTEGFFVNLRGEGFGGLSNHPRDFTSIITTN
jgi:hypothetical protein